MSDRPPLQMALGLAVAFAKDYERSPVGEKFSILVDYIEMALFDQQPSGVTPAGTSPDGCTVKAQP